MDEVIKVFNIDGRRLVGKPRRRWEDAADGEMLLDVRNWRTIWAETVGVKRLWETYEFYEKFTAKYETFSDVRGDILHSTTNIYETEYSIFFSVAQPPWSVDWQTWNHRSHSNHSPFSRIYEKLFWEFIFNFTKNTVK